MSARRRPSSSPGLSTATTWSPGRITVSPTASSATPPRMTETSREPSGSARPATRFPAAGDDRWVALAIHDDLDWSRLRAELGNPEWAANPTLATMAGRLHQTDELERCLGAWTKEQRAEELVERLQRAGLDAAVVEDMQDLKADEQLAHRGHFRKLEHPVLGEYVVEAVAGVRFSDSLVRLERPAPCLGADNEEVYCRLLGLANREFEELETAGVVR